MKLLVIEDDALVAQALSTVLTQHNYAVEVAADGQAGWALIEAFDYDLILLDVVLPKLDGVQLCQMARSQGYTMPILLLTGCDSHHDKAIGLDAGADDYVVKPFDPEELVARIRALLRRAGAIAHPLLTWGQLCLDPRDCKVTYGETLLALTPKEYALLELFLRNSRRVFSCGAILEHLWAYEEAPGEDAVRTHIKGLRQKLKAAGAATDLIETVYGIGYRLHALEPLASLGSAALAEVTQQQTLALIAGVWQRMGDRVSEQVTVLETAVTALGQHQLSADLQQQAQQQAHTLAGSLGTFGLAKGSQIARAIEDLWQSEHRDTAKTLKKLRKLVIALRQEVQRAAKATRPVPVTSGEEPHPLICLVDGDRAFTAALVQTAESYGLRTTTASSNADRHGATAPPLDEAQVILLDLDQPNPLPGLTLLAELSHRVPPVPVVVMTAPIRLTERLNIVRHGGRIVLQKPVTPAQVWETVLQVLKQADSLQAKVLVVDDDPALLAALKTLLTPWGLKVTTLADPQKFWETLEACIPDLLILDVALPQISGIEISGIELCQVVRHDSRWAGLPIVFLTAHAQAKVINQVFAAGADDFVSKPVVGPELVTRILNRLERIALLRRLAETDRLTGVANRQKSTQMLEEFLGFAQRYDQPVTLAVLGLDQFQRVNATMGHDLGDDLLRALGHLLRQGFHGEDVVACWRGDEFVIGMYGMTRQEGRQRLMLTLAGWRQHVFTMAAGDRLSVTLSAGLAQYPEDGADLQALYRAAREALDWAQTMGGDRIAPLDDLYPN